MPSTASSPAWCGSTIRGRGDRCRSPCRLQRFLAVRGALMLSTPGAPISTTWWAAERLGNFKVFPGDAQRHAGAVVSARRHHRGTGATARRQRPRWCGGAPARRVEIPDFTMRRDEIGDLSGALRGHGRTRSTAASRRSRASRPISVAHELKNPLTSMRSAVETLPLAKTDASRARLAGR